MVVYPGMKIKNAFRQLVQTIARCLPFWPRRRALTPSASQLELDLDQPTASGLPLREALPVRSAEYWLELGHPDQALAELETLPEPARRHPWFQRVHFAATLATLRRRQSPQAAPECPGSFPTDWTWLLIKGFRFKQSFANC